MKLWFKVRSLSSDSSSSSARSLQCPTASCSGSRKRGVHASHNKKRGRSTSSDSARYDDDMTAFRRRRNARESQASAVSIARDLFRRGKISGAELSEIIEGDKRFWETPDISASSAASVLLKLRTSPIVVAERVQEEPTASRVQEEPLEKEEPKPDLGKDPIMLVDLKPSDTTYTFVRSNGTALRYNVATLIDYMLATGCFFEPGTRIPFSDKELKAIDDCASRGCLQKRSVFTAKYGSSKQYEDLKFARDAIEGLERCAGEVVRELLELIEGSQDDADEEERPASANPLPAAMRYLGQLARGSSSSSSSESSSESDQSEELQVRILTDVFPRIKHYLLQIAEQDEAYAKQCVAHWKAFLVGPPNNRTRDRLDVLGCCLTLLDSAL